MLKKVLKHSKVNTQTSKGEVLKFIDHYFCNTSKNLNGKLIHIRDDKNKIAINKKLDYLKIRRVE